MSAQHKRRAGAGASTAASLDAIAETLEKILHLLEVIGECEMSIRDLLKALLDKQTAQPGKYVL